MIVGYRDGCRRFLCCWSSVAGWIWMAGWRPLAPFIRSSTDVVKVKCFHPPARGSI